MLNDRVLKVLLGSALGLHLAAPAVGLAIDQRVPIAVALLIFGEVGLGVMAWERPRSLDPLVLIVGGIHLMATAAGCWWLLAATSAPAAVLAWISYAIDLLWLAVALTFMFTFRMNRLW